MVQLKLIAQPVLVSMAVMLFVQFSLFLYPFHSHAEMRFVVTRASLSESKISDLMWLGDEFEIQYQEVREKTQPYIVLKGNYLKPNFDLYAENRLVTRTAEGGFKFKVGFRVKPVHLSMRAIGPNGKLESEEFLLTKIATNEPLPEEIREDIKEHLTVIFHIGMPVGSYKSIYGGLLTTTNLYANTLEGGLASYYYRDSSEFSRVLEVGVLGKVGYSWVSAIALPLNYSLTGQLSLRNGVGRQTSVSISPLIQYQHELFSIPSVILALTGFEVNTYYNNWIGVGVKFTFRNFLKLEVVPTFSLLLKSTSVLSSTAVVLNHTGWKAELGVSSGGKYFIGINGLLLNVAGDSQMTSLIGVALGGVRL